MELAEESDIKPELPNTGYQICRICLRSAQSKNMKRVADLKHYFLYLADIDVSNRDGLPQQLCLECRAHLIKASKFKKKISETHAYLSKKVSLDTSIQFKVSELALLDQTLPKLSLSETSTIDIAPSEGCDNQHIYHQERVECEYDDYLEAESLFEDKAIKQELQDASDQEDDLSLLQVKEISSQFEIKEENTIGQDLIKMQTKKRTSKGRQKTKEKRKKAKKIKKNRHKTVSSVEEIDPTKIREVVLSLEDQIKFLKEEANNPKYLKFPFKCEECVKGFNHETKLFNHLKKHDKSRGNFKCKLCGMYLPSTQSFNIHRRTHSTRYECRRCGLCLASKMCIIDHYRTNHEGFISQFKCEICGKISGNIITHRGHMKNKHGTERPKCHLCGKTFVNKDSLSEHFLIHKGIKNHECKVCLRRFRTMTQLKTHGLSHSSDRQFYCVECDVKFKSAHNLRQHLLKSKPHLDPTNLKFECEICGVRQVSPGALAHHVTWGHERRRLFACDECPARLATQQSLNKHIRVTHRGVLPARKYSCNTCGRAFSSKAVLLNHMRTHTGEKPFECEKCHKKFAQKTGLITHVKLVHLKQKRKSMAKKIFVAPVMIKSEDENQESASSKKIFLTGEQLKILQVANPSETSWQGRAHSDHSYFSPN